MGQASAPDTLGDQGGPHDQVVELDDGRTLGWASYGDPSGVPLVFLHGTPGSRLDAYTLHDAALERGIHLIAPDRPGMGRSTHVAERRLVDHPDEVAQLADRLGLDRFSVLGYSGGGPYGLVCALRLAHRIDRAVVVSGCSPPDRPAAIHDTGLIDRVLTTFARHVPWAADALLDSMRLGARVFPGIGTRLWESDLSGTDRAAYEEMVRGGDVNPLGSFLESVRQGPRGVALDYRLLAEPWGFLPEEISHRVLFWHGDTDVIVPLHHAHDLMARMPDAQLNVVPGAGHLLVRSAAGEILDQVAASAG